MKKFLIRLLAFIFVLSLSILIIVSYMIKYTKEHCNYFGAYGYKIEMMKDTPFPRIIFLGGDNLAFGINSKSVADSLGFNVVNYGLSSDLGLKLMIYDAIEYCKDGDILIISPEYEHFFGKAQGDKQALAILTLLNPSIINRFDKQHCILVLSGLKESIGSLARNIILEEQDSDDLKYHYSSDSFNNYGDDSRHWEYPHQGNKLIVSKEDYIFDESFFNDFLSQISILENKGVKVVIMPPSISLSYYDVHNNDIDLISKKLSEAGYHFAIAPKDMCFEEEYIFDTYYHLTKEGIDIRMPLIIEVLKPLIGENGK